jgi:hypothetical protein
MVRAGGRRRALAPRCPVPPFHEPMLVRRPALRRHRHFPAAKAGTTKAPLLVMKCAAEIVASPQGRGNRRSVGTPWKASLHRTRWNAFLQCRTAWKRSLKFRSWRARFHPGPDHTHSGGQSPHSMRCRDSPRRLRLREALGVRQLAGAVEAALYYRRPTAPALLYTNDRSFWGPDHTPLEDPAPPRPRVVDPHSWQGPEDSKAPPAELLRRTAAELAGGWEKT